MKKKAEKIDGCEAGEENVLRCGEQTIRHRSSSDVS